MTHRSGRRTLAGLLTLSLMIALAPMLMGKRKVKLPKNTPLSAATERRVQEAETLAARSAEDWGALEQRYGKGDVSRQDIVELRVYWASTASPLYADSEWPLRWIDAGMPTHYAVRLVGAVRDGDLLRIDHEVEDMATAPPGPGTELRLLQVAANWGLGKESRAAVIYDNVIESEGVLAYYDTALEEWLRDRAAEVAAGEEPSYTPRDAQKKDALRMELLGRGVPGKFLLSFLEPKPVVHAAAVRVGSLEPDVVSEVFANHTIDWYYCYAHEGGEEMLGPGTILFDFGVDPFGRVEFCSTRPGGDLRNPTLRDCCCDTIEGMRFPIPDGGGIATERYKLTFPIKI